MIQARATHLYDVKLVLASELVQVVRGVFNKGMYLKIVNLIKPIFNQ